MGSYAGNRSATHEQRRQRRHQRDRQHGGGGHGERFGVGQWTEQTPFLRLQREDRQKRHRDDE